MKLINKTDKKYSVRSQCKLGFGGSLMKKQLCFVGGMSRAWPEDLRIAAIFP